MDVEILYQQKLTSPENACAVLRDKQNLILGMGVAMPPRLVEAVANIIKGDDFSVLNIYYMHGSQVLSETLLKPELSHKICPRPLFMSSHDRAALKCLPNRSLMEFVPATFHQVGRLLTEQIEPHCFMVTVSPMDKHGYFSLGTNADYGASVIRKAHHVVVEVNDNMPRTFGECSVHISEVDAIIEYHTPLTEIPSHPPSDIDIKIAHLIADRINDGDTLQMGVGGVPSAVLSLLKNHKDLGLHSELFCPAMVDLICTGVINGKKKSWMQHKHIFTLALGDKAMYDFMDDNPSIVGYPASWVNNPSIIQKNHNMVSVNAAIEVDLSGQINAEQIAGQTFSGTGGQLDFVRGAYSSRGGRSFIALNATAKKGAVSRIVLRLDGGAVTDTRMDTHFVVTEYGCVDLKGLSLPQRAKALIGIAHPDFREALTQQAMESGCI
ncbi:MAG: acetyl-CoA hydrolase/transferase family protein [Oleispira antarctica]|nr:acetyl-CoA hydrolase/transferase family protein [Oleispira antarctica]MBQ0793168.1 acetyl-CoA hydrolase/transferase family protein [Oleispira antarctica]